MKVRRNKAFYVQCEFTTMLLREDGDGDVLWEMGTEQHAQIIYARGPQEAERMVHDDVPEDYITEVSVLPIRHLRLARRMLEGDGFAPEWDYYQGQVEEDIEEWETDQEPGR
jgi:hypothetical protein